MLLIWNAHAGRLYYTHKSTQTLACNPHCQTTQILMLPGHHLHTHEAKDVPTCLTISLLLNCSMQRRGGTCRLKQRPTMNTCRARLLDNFKALTWHPADANQVRGERGFPHAQGPTSWWHHNEYRSSTEAAWLNMAVPAEADPCIPCKSCTALKP